MVSHSLHPPLSVRRCVGVWQVISDSRAVVLAGGTLQPMSDLRDRLFPHLPPTRIHPFSCGHIVPKESVLAMALSRGPSGQLFDFTFRSRASPATVTHHRMPPGTPLLLHPEELRASFRIILDLTLLSCSVRSV